MATYRIDESGAFVPYEEAELDFEASLENWLEKNPHVLAEGEQPPLVIGRQVTTSLNRRIDLLAIDEQGRVIIVELKKDRTPRDVVAQALEYAASVEGLTYDELNEIAERYFAKQSFYDGQQRSLASAYLDHFPVARSEGEQSRLPVWNHEQIILIAACTVTDDVENVARYLRRRNIDVRCLQVSVHKGPNNDKIAVTTVLVGEEQLRPKSTGSSTPPVPTIREKVEAVLNDFVRPFRVAEFYDAFANKYPELIQQIRRRYTSPYFNDRVYLSLQFDAARKRGYIVPMTPEDKRAVEGWPYPQPLFQRVDES